MRIVLALSCLALLGCGQDTSGLEARLAALEGQADSTSSGERLAALESQTLEERRAAEEAALRLAQLGSIQAQLVSAQEQLASQETQVRADRESLADVLASLQARVGAHEGQLEEMLELLTELHSQKIVVPSLSEDAAKLLAPPMKGVVDADEKPVVPTLDLEGLKADFKANRHRAESVYEGKTFLIEGLKISGPRVSQSTRGWYLSANHASEYYPTAGDMEVGFYLGSIHIEGGDQVDDLFLNLDLSSDFVVDIVAEVEFDVTAPTFVQGVLVRLETKSARIVRAYR